MMPSSTPLHRKTNPGRARRAARRAFLVLAVLLVLALGGGFWLRSRVRADLPQVVGERAVPGLAAPVTIRRDALGVPLVSGADRLDVARATGFLHAQERFFQMDLSRRKAAGELAEILGPPLVQEDRKNRVHGFRALAREALARSRPEERAIIEAYTQGVNAGLAALAAPPFEYLLLRADPIPWRAEDTVLVILAMYLELQHGSYPESSLGLLYELLPPPLADFLAPAGTDRDAPLVGGPLPTPPIPGPDVLDLRRTPPKAAALSRRGPRSPGDERAIAGSNSWAVAGSHTADGHAWVANDMHLPLGLPNLWYHAALSWPQAGETRRLVGVMLPGTPAIVVGSSGHVAWGFSNSQGDWSDLVVLEVDPRHPDLYLTPAGPRAFERRREKIRVHGGKDVPLEVRWTIWGPVVGSDHRGRLQALAWIAHDPAAVNLGILGLEEARTVEQAVEVAHRSGMPPQNFVVADDSGRIAWTIMGRLPRRVGFDGRLPVSWADGSRRWDGWLDTREVPRVVDPPSGRLWTANNRIVDGPMLSSLGDGGYDFGARAGQIRDALFALDRARPEDFLALQLDDRALWLARWRDLLLKTLTPKAVGASPRRALFRHLVESRWTGRASIDSVGYRLVRGFRIAVSDQVFASLAAPCLAVDPDFSPTPQFEGPLWKVVTERPPHLLDPHYRTWDEQFLAAVDALLDSYEKKKGTLADRSWGEFNTLSIQHPMSLALPFLSHWLDVPARPLPGDFNMPRVQHPAFGASERLVVSPGREERGFFEMPGGESGNPLSPHYADGERAWEEGRPTALLPGPVVDTLRLVPERPRRAHA
jgi:penicillin amidase